MNKLILATKISNKGLQGTINDMNLTAADSVWERTT